MYTLEQLQNKSINELKEIGCELNVFPEGDRRYRENWIKTIVADCLLLELLEVSPAEVQAQDASKVQAQEPIVPVAETSPGVDVEPVQDAPLESKFGRIIYPRPDQKPNENKTHKTDTHRVGAGSDQSHSRRNSDTTDSLASSKSFKTGANKSQICNQLLATPGDSERDRREALLHQPAKLAAVETSPGVDVDQFPKCSQCFDDGYFEDESGLIKSCICSSEPKLSRQKTQRAIVPDRNLSLTGIPLSDRFLARYSPPQSESLRYEITDGYKVETDGQLRLFEAQTVAEPEPPDPDDFESLDAFREAIALWDSEHCETNSEHCETNSEHCEPPDPDDFDSMFAFWAAYDAWDESSDDDSEPSSIDKPLEVSLDSFCEWAPCPDEWYEPVALLDQCEVSELSPACKSSSTLDFFIPTFDAWCDRQNRSDEPPDTGIFARLPAPKPPKFPPRAIGYTQPNRPLLAASRNYPETIPKLFSVVAGSSTQPARSPPGGDAKFA